MCGNEITSERFNQVQPHETLLFNVAMYHELTIESLKFIFCYYQFNETGCLNGNYPFFDLPLFSCGSV